MPKTRSFEEVRIFIASPGDLQEERRLFRDLINDINRARADMSGKRLIAVGWEDTLPGWGRPQVQINEDLLSCDLVLFLLWTRWGTPSGAYSSGFAEEYALAKTHKLDALFYFRQIPTKMMADAGPQLQQVLDFRDTIETERTFLYKFYESEKDWRDLAFDHICRWLDKRAQEPPPSIDAKAIQKERDELRIERDAYQNDLLNERLERAWEYANEGRLTKAQEKFAQAVEEHQHPEASLAYGSFLRRIGLLDESLEQLQTALHDSQLAENPTWIAQSHNHIGIVHQIRGDLDQAETMYQQALAINQQLECKEGMAANYGNLGNVYRIRGDLSQAETMLLHALEIDQELSHKQHTAISYNNLGNIHRRRGNLTQAESMYQQALEISQQLGDKNSIASHYNNLGIVYQSRDDLAQAESMYQQALKINQQLGNKEGMAIQYSNLGLLFKKRNDLTQAESMYQQALEINQQLGNKEGMAIQYSNLGLLFKQKGYFSRALDYWQQALSLWKAVGHQGSTEKVQAWIAEAEAKIQEPPTS